MEHNDIINTLNTDEIKTSTYADIYLDNDVCKSSGGSKEINTNNVVSFSSFNFNSTWISPSDQLIGIVDLKPPFTSKNTRGKTHEGILSIGDIILKCEQERIYEIIFNLLQDNDDTWNFILENEKKKIFKKVNNIYQNLFKHKSAIMMKEIFSFYEKTLSELEDHIKCEVKTVAESTYASIITQANDKLQKILENERCTLENQLNNQFKMEINKVKKYYQLLLKHEQFRCNNLKNKLIQEKNEAIKAFLKQIEAERLTSTMYVLSLERKKCKIKRMFLEKLQHAEIMEYLQMLEEKDALLVDLDKKEIMSSILNSQWEQQIVKILRLFLKFISYCLKLLPEQTTFLLDFEKMVILQLNEMQKHPDFTISTLIDEQDQLNVFNFYQTDAEFSVCDKEPFTVVGDLSNPVPQIHTYGSRESLDSDVDLPYFRLQGQYIYAKCHGYEEIKKMLNSNTCKCTNPKFESTSEVSIETEQVQDSITISSKSISSHERLVSEDVNRLQECPKKCGKRITFYDFPFLPSYLDYTEQNYIRAKTILDKDLEQPLLTDAIKVKDIVRTELPFSATTEKFKTIGTQFSSEEDFHFTDISCECECIRNDSRTSEKLRVEYVFAKREKSLSKLLRDNPKLYTLFSDECYDTKI